MKFSNLPWLFLLLPFIYACDEQSQRSVAESQSTKAMIPPVVTKSSQPLPQLEKVIQKDQQAKLDNATQKQMTDAAVLNLSLPGNDPSPDKPESNHRQQPQAVLPDLFTAEKNNNNLELDGKIIRREEEEVGKDRVIDGVGIDIKLSP